MSETSSLTNGPFPPPAQPHRTSSVQLIAPLPLARLRDGRHRRRSANLERAAHVFVDGRFGVVVGHADDVLPTVGTWRGIVPRGQRPGDLLAVLRANAGIRREYARVVPVRRARWRLLDLEAYIPGSCSLVEFEACALRASSSCGGKGFPLLSARRIIPSHAFRLK